jgi:DNA-binding NarL/FixJ family response regulator
MINVLLVDDHPVVTEGLRLALDADADVTVVGTARTLEEARTALDELDPDVAVIDIRLGTQNGLELLSHRTDVRFVVLSSFGGRPYVESAFRLGAGGFYLKTSPIDALIAGIKQVAEGRTAFDPDAMRIGTERWHPLSERERAVVKLMMAGRSNVGHREQDGRDASDPPLRAVRGRDADGAGAEGRARRLAGRPPPLSRAVLRE